MSSSINNIESSSQPAVVNANASRAAAASSRATIIENAVGKVPNVDKYRRMVCLSYLFCGACTYQQCVFLHDVRIASTFSKAAAFGKRKVVGGAAGGAAASRGSGTNCSGGTTPNIDAFYWPLLDISGVLVDPKSSVPCLFQTYSIPDSFKVFDKGTVHNRSLYSIWNFLVECCHNKPATTTATTTTTTTVMYMNSEPPEIDFNRFLGTKRLKIFVSLSAGKNVRRPQKH